MKIIILFAFFALVSAKALDQSVLENQSLQDLYDCRPGEECADKLVSANDNFPEAVEKACLICSSEQKNNMAAFVEAINKGMSLEEAKKFYNPDNKYNFPEAVEKACPKCSFEQKNNMAAFVEAINKGASLEEAIKFYNPDNEYFDNVDNPDTSFTFDATVNAS